MSKTLDVVRVLLKHEHDDDEISFMNVYVDTNFTIKVGDKITLQDSEAPEIHWQVIAIYEVVKRTDIKRGWDNNI